MGFSPQERNDNGMLKALYRLSNDEGICAGGPAARKSHQHHHARRSSRMNEYTRTPTMGLKPGNIP